jgi:hypothetical protein
MAISKVNSKGLDPTDFNVDDGTLVVDSTNNNVGIGTTPDTDAQLHIRSNDTIIRMEDADDNGSYADIRYLNGRLVIQSDDNSSSGYSPTIEFQVDDSEAMRIDSTGNVGIGTTDTTTVAQAGKLKVRNDVDYSSTEFEDNATLLLQNETNNHSAALVFHSNNSSGSSKRAGIVGGNINSNTAALGFYGDISNKTSGTSPDMVIDSSGIIKTPYQPAFKQYLNTSVSSVTGANTVKSDNGTFSSLWVDSAYGYNIGNHFSSGTFTAPVNGIYQFTGAACVYGSLQGTGDAQYCEFYKNNSSNTGGNIAGLVMYDPRSIRWDQAYSVTGGTAIMKLAANDTVAFVFGLLDYGSNAFDIVGGTAWYGTFFSGHLVSGTN